VFYKVYEILFMGDLCDPLGVGMRGVFIRRWLAMGLDHAAVTTKVRPLWVFF
jgi:hypothetical protein